MSTGTRSKFYADIMACHPEVTGSCTLVVVKFPDGTNSKFVVDCGLFQEREYSVYNTEFPFDPTDIDFAVITHNHIDHTGRLPLLVKKGYSKEIYTTKETKILIEPALEDSYRVLRQLGKRENTKELYSSQDVGNALSLIKGCSYNEEIWANPNIRLYFLPNGHLNGAAMILVKIGCIGYNDINLLFTGDFNKRNTFFEVPEVPREVLDLPLTIIQESTYGDMDSSQIEYTFDDKLIQAVESGKTVITPAYSLGRAQEVLYRIKQLQDSGKLSKNIPVYLDGKLAIRYTSLYLSGNINILPEKKNFLPSGMIQVDKELRQKIIADDSAKIIVCSSGSGSYGPAQTYIQEFLSRRNALILFTGFTPKDSLGSRLENTPIGETVQVGGLVIVRRAEVSYVNEFSAHAKSDEMLEFLDKFEAPKLILVNHGAESVKELFAQKIIKTVKNAKKVGILDRRYFFRVDTYGLIKTMSTKFE